MKTCFHSKSLQKAVTQKIFDKRFSVKILAESCFRRKSLRKLFSQKICAKSGFHRKSWQKAAFAENLCENLLLQKNLCENLLSQHNLCENPFYKGNIGRKLIPQGKYLFTENLCQEYLLQEATNKENFNSQWKPVWKALFAPKQHFTVKYTHFYAHLYSIDFYLLMSAVLWARCCDFAVDQSW